MRKNTKAKLTGRILLMGLFLAISLSAAGQVDFNVTKDWGVSGNYHYNMYDNSVSINLLYKYKKNCFLAGYGLRFTNAENYVKDTEPEYFLGYMRYPLKNLKPVKLFYQVFLYYSANHALAPYISESYLTCNVGLGVDYNFSKKFSGKLSTNAGAGYEFNLNSVIYTIFPINISVAYLF